MHTKIMFDTLICMNVDHDKKRFAFSIIAEFTPTRTVSLSKLQRYTSRK
jgi:hypothetical protein